MKEKLISYLLVLLKTVVKNSASAKKGAILFDAMQVVFEQKGLPTFRYVELVSGFNDEVYKMKIEDNRITVTIHKGYAEVAVVKEAPKFNKVPYNIKRYCEPVEHYKIQ